MAEALAPFVWGSGGSRDTVSRRRQLAEALMKSGMDYSPVGHWTQGAARVAQALLGAFESNQVDKQEKASNEALASALTGAFGGAGSPASGAPAASGSAPSFAGGGAARTMAMPNVTPEIKTGIADAAGALGVSPVDLATAISYETGGTFDPTKAGPTTKWGQHRGLIQFGEPQARQYGVDWSNPVGSQLGANGAVVAYLRDRGVRPGMGLMDIYSTINAGAPGLYGRSDAAAGGAPGTVADKVNSQMAGHRAKAQRLFADAPAAGASPASMETGEDGFAVPPAPAPAMSGATFNAISAGQPLDPVFTTEGISQPWMGTALTPPAPAGPQMVQAPLPPARPNDLADIPAEGAVPAIGQMPPAVTAPVVDPNSPDAGVRALIAAEAQGGGNPFSGIAQALTGGGSVPSSSASPSVQNVAQAMMPQPAQAAAAAPSNPLAAMAIALARSGDRDGAVKLATSLLQPQAPIVMGDRLVSRDGRVIADFTQANGGRSSKYGLNPIYGTDAQGNTVMLQAGEKGDAVTTKLPEGVKLATGVDKIDAGTHFVLMDKRTGQVVGTLPKDVAGVERAQVEGKAAGEAKVDLPRVIANAEQMLGTIEGIRNHPGRNSFGATGWGSTFPIVGEGMPGSEGRDFVARVDQLKGKAFLEAFNSLKGGGQITEVEGKKATDAIARLDRAQSRKGFDEALNDLEAVVRDAMGRARAKAGIKAEPALGSVDTSKPGNFRFNPATGKMEPA